MKPPFFLLPSLPFLAYAFWHFLVWFLCLSQRKLHLLFSYSTLLSSIRLPRYFLDLYLYVFKRAVIHRNLLWFSSSVRLSSEMNAGFWKGDVT